MVNKTHLKVLLKKDLITLWRSIGFLIAFIVLPIGLMELFVYLKNLIDNGEKSGSLIFDYFRYSTTLPPLQSIQFYDYQAVDIDYEIPKVIISSLAYGCQKKNNAKYYYSKIAIVSENKTLALQLKSYFSDYVVPNTLLINNKTKKKFQVDEFQSIDQVNSIISDQNDQPYCFTLYFKKFSVVDDQYDIQFSFDGSRLPNTLLPSFVPQIKAPDLNSWNKWFDTGSVVIYPYITEFIARYKSCVGKEDFKNLNSSDPLYTQQLGYTPMKTRPYEDIPFQAIDQLSRNYPFFLMIIFMIPFFYITSKMASEKESKSKEGMKMMGLNDSTYYLAWFILFSLISFVTSLIVSIITCVRLFKNINFIILFTFLTFYSWTLLGLAFIIVAFLPNKRSSAVAAVLLNFMTFFLSPILQDPATPQSYQYFLSIFPNVCMNQIVKQIFYLTFQTKDGLTFQTSGIIYQGYSFKIGIIFIMIEAITLFLLGIYLDQVIPSQYGVAKPWNFMCKKKKKVSDNNNKLEQIYDDELIQNNINQLGINFEPVPDILRKQEQGDEKQCLQIKNLVKRFGDKEAVKGVNMTMYNGQIFALLGHNGAGKTTTLSMLTGLLNPTSGKAEVMGIDILQNMSEFRKILGVCPQHDVLFEMLTAEEHLRLFASFKGTDPDKIEGMVSQMIKDISLDTGKYQLSKTFSGGQKRKLSVAIAMIGNSKIVLLDEPSSGMDTTARRRMWEMLKKNKAGKIIILTTHYMDEADILGDRIAIMAEGNVQCIGSPLFLKNRFGVGYNLKIDKKNRDKAPQIDQFIFQRIQNAVKMQEVSSEITYQLPTESSPLFKQFFQDFDQNLDSLGIRSYGVGITTLEEVFLKIGHGIQEINQEKSIKDDDSLKKGQPINLSIGASTENSQIDNYSINNQVNEKNNFFPQLFVLIKKKFLMQIRDLKSLGIDTLFPIVLILIGLKLSTIAVIKNQVDKQMSPTLLPGNTIFYNNQSQFINDSLKIENFMQNYFVSPQKDLYSLGQSIPISLNQSFQNLTLQVIEQDNFVFGHTDQTGNPSYAQMYVQTLNDPFNGYSGILLLNSTSKDVAGIFSAYAHVAFLKQYLQDYSISFNTNMNVNFIDKPFPLTRQSQAIITAASGTTSALLIAIAWLMISDSLIQNIIKERQRNIKHQIMVSGSSLKAYWMGHYICDIIFQALPSLVAIIGLQVFNIEVEDVYILFIFMIFSNPTFIYFLSFLFEKEETGSLVVKMIYFIIGIIGPITISILQVVNQDTASVAKWLRWFFYPFPIYSLTFGYMSICNRDIIQIQNRLPSRPEPLDQNVAGLSLYFLIGTTFAYWILISFFELKLVDILLCKKQKKSPKLSKTNQNGKYHPLDRISLLDGFKEQEQLFEDDIAIEANRVDQMNTETSPVKVSNIKKFFGNKAAVKNVSFGLEFGECFALLGVSGAGKTTCFKCLTGEMYPSQGQLTVFGNDITTSSGFQKARKMIGYCPQFDTIFDGLTVREHLEIYSTIKGVKSDLKQQIISKQIKEMDLSDYENIRANNLSGGNKRKLSVSIAMIGNPPLIFLDEPSTGVDPQAKRFMWDIVSKISTQKKQSAVIITTHSMEEAEALCTKMGIMVQGEFKCFGSATYIKDKYGTGYEIEIKIRQIKEDEINQIIQENQKIIPFNMQNYQIYLKTKDSDYLIDEICEEGLGSDFYDQLETQKYINEQELIKWHFVESSGQKVINLLESKFKEFEILEHYGNFWKLRVSRDNFSIGYLFGMMEDLKNQYDISEYSVAQTTLEQIFNNFALQAELEQGKSRKKKSQKKKDKISDFNPYQDQSLDLTNR